MNQNFIPLETTIRRGIRYKEGNRGDESIQVEIHIYMEMSQGYSYLKQTKRSGFFLLQNQKTEDHNKSCPEGLIPVRWGRRWGVGNQKPQSDRVSVA
jgi:hypothetical protein